METPDGKYRITRFRTFTHRLAGWLPSAWREPIAEHWLRRPDSPGPAAEHVIQYLLSAGKPVNGGRTAREAKVAVGADHFYDRQYRQYLNPTMGVFAATATQALIASGGNPKGRLWRRHRRTYSAMLEQSGNALPIVVIDRQSIALPLFLPRPKRQGEAAAVSRWLSGSDSMPNYYRDMVAGNAIRCEEPRVKAREQTAVGAVLETMNAALASRRLAILALHPHDPDAMGLHITLFGIEILTPERLVSEYGLEPAAIEAHSEAMLRTDSMLVFCVGCTEEVFTQCSQNLFVKRPRPDPESRLQPEPEPPISALKRLIPQQFETIQVTASASGLPGASPRNGVIGKAAFMSHRRNRTVLLIPYHPGNAVHGHAAKLWSNRYGSLVISDDHHALSRVTVSGPARIIGHRTARRQFPEVTAQVASQIGHNGKAVADPEYWFVQEVAELVQQRERLSANTLDATRPACSISAGGQAHHGKKPGYFNADELPPYDQHLQHRREAAERPTDPTGSQRRQWLETSRAALETRRLHLQKVLPDRESSERNDIDLPT
jgi:hypothetical protein